MSGKSKVIKNYIYNTAYEVLKILAPLITTPYVSRVLGASGVGTYSYAQSIATYFVLIGSMGISLYGQREIAYVQDDFEKRSHIFWEIEVLRFCAALVSAIIFLLVFGKESIIFRILSLEVLATAIDISWFFMGMEDFKTTVIRNTIIKLVGIFLVFTLVKTAEDVPLYTFCVTIPLFLGNLSLWASLKKNLVKVGNPLFSDVVKHFKPIIALFVPQMAVEVYVVMDKTMIGVLSADMSQVGYYTQAQKVIKIVLLVITSLGTVMLPAMSAAYARGEHERIKNSIGKAFRFVFLLAFPLLFGICAISNRFVPFFFGQGFDLVEPIMIVISPILVIIGMSNVIGRQYLLPTKQQKVFTTSVVSGAAVNFVLNCILIRQFNAIGASVASVIAEITVASIQMWYVRKQLPLKNYFMPMIKYFLLGVFMFLVISEVDRILPNKSIYMLVIVAVGMTVYVIELFVVKDEMLFQALYMIRKKLNKT